MRHQKSGRKFGRNSSHRKAMLRNLATPLIVHERIKTTDAKAKELRRVAEKLVTKAARVADLSLAEDLSVEERAKLVHARRVAAKHLRPWATDSEDRTVDVLGKLFDELGPRFQDRPGGYTRIIKLPGLRKGDGAPMSIIEFVDYDEVRAEAEERAEEEGEGDGKKGGFLSGLFGGKGKSAEDEE